MKPYLFILLAALLFVSCKDSFDDNSKRNENYAWWVDARTGKAGWIPVNGNGDPVKTGKYTLFYADGHVFEKGRKVDGKNVDTIFSYLSNGEVYEYTFVRPDTTTYYFIKNGPITIHEQSGKLSADGIVENHKAGNQWIHYYPSGNIEWKRSFKNGIGWNVSYYESGSVNDSDYNDGKNFKNIEHWTMLGKLESKFEMNGNTSNGVQWRYYDNGQPRSSLILVNGQEEGKLVNWYPNGQVKLITYLKNGLKNGRVTQYYKDGKIQSEGNFIDDKVEGRGFLYFESGKIKIDRYFKDGQSDGEAREYDESGKLMRDNIYKNGELIEEKLKNKPLLVP